MKCKCWGHMVEVLSDTCHFVLCPLLMEMCVIEHNNWKAIPEFNSDKHKGNILVEEDNSF
jgi:hypothetical protein